MLLDYITLASFINFLFLAIVLMIKKSTDKQSNTILFALFLFMALYSGLVLFHYTALESRQYNLLRFYAPVEGLVLLAMGPCLYFYILSVLNKSIVFTKPKSLLHVIPFIPYLLFNFHFISLPSESRIAWLVQDFTEGSWEMKWLNGLLYLQIITYLIVCYRIVSQQLKLCRTVVFDKKRYDVSWLQTYLIINLCFLLISCPLCFYFDNERISIIIGQFGMDVQVIYMFFKWTMHADIQVVSIMDECKQNKNSTLPNKSESDESLQRLLRYMEVETPFFNEECSLKTVAQQTGIPEYQLTQLLKCSLLKNFPDFINEYRIDEAKLLLLSGKSDTATIESIAHECGFGSKSAFQRSFKKFSNNLTPTEYVRQYKISD